MARSSCFRQGILANPTTAKKLPLTLAEKGCFDQHCNFDAVVPTTVTQGLNYFLSFFGIVVLIQLPYAFELLDVNPKANNGVQHSVDVVFVLAFERPWRVYIAYIPREDSGFMESMSANT